LEADGRSRGYHADERLPLTYEQAAEWLEDSSPRGQTPALVEHAQQAGRLAALAIGALDRDAPSVPEAIADCLAHLLVVCVLADEAGQHGTR
jgi:sirohydrochlorin ferrochelatase